MMYSKIETAPQDGTEIVVLAGLFSCVAKWDGRGWYADTHGRYIKATHWHKYIPWPWS